MGRVIRFYRRNFFTRTETNVAAPVSLMLACAGLFLFFYWVPLETLRHHAYHEADISCYSPRIIDGDTLHCGDDRIRLASIDAPEMNGQCRRGRRCVSGDPDAARDYLYDLSRGQVICRDQGTDHYGRTIARCWNEADVDFSCAMVEAGHAVERYGRLYC